MARATINVTDTWQQVAVGQAVVTVERAGGKTLLVNEVASDVNASEFSLEKSDQLWQNETLPTFIRSVSPNWILTVDGVLV